MSRVYYPKSCLVYKLCVALEIRVSAQHSTGRSRCIGTRICRCEAHLPAADSEWYDDLEKALPASGILGSFADLAISSSVQAAYQLWPLNERQSMLFPASEVNPSEIADKELVGQLEEGRDFRII